MGALHKARPQFDRRRKHRIDTQIVETDRRAENVDDRIRGTDLMEGNLVDLDTMDPCLGFGDDTKNTSGRRLDALLEKPP